MFRFSARSKVLLASAVVASLNAKTHAALFATYSSGYTQGTIYEDEAGDINSYDMSFNDPTVVGDPTVSPTAGLTNLDFSFPQVISPFDPPSDADQNVTIGLGGSAIFAFPKPINVVPGGTIGVFTTVGLFDNAYPNGVATSPATEFDQQSAIVQVSQDGTNWHSLGLVNFTIPENYFTNATNQYQFPAPDPGVVADFGQPFAGTLDSFDGQDYAQILTTLNGSAGGTWLDLSSTGLTQVQYIQFSEPAGDVDMTSYVGISAISAADASVPEPASAAMLLVVGGLALRRRAAKSK